MIGKELRNNYHNQEHSKVKLSDKIAGVVWTTTSIVVVSLATADMTLKRRTRPTRAEKKAENPDQATEPDERSQLNLSSAGNDRVELTTVSRPGVGNTRITRRDMSATPADLGTEDRPVDIEGTLRAVRKAHGKGHPSGVVG